MAEIASNVGTGRAVRLSFFFWLAIAMAVLVFGGFGISYFQPMAAGTFPSASPVVHVHGFFYFSWMVFLVVQVALVNQGNVVLHRSLGLLGISIGTAAVIFGCMVTILFTQRLVADSDATVYGLMYISLLAVLGFSVLLVLALRNLRNSEAHKRYILLATASFLIAGFNRIFQGVFGLGVETDLTYLPRYLAVDAFIVALIVYDWRTLGKLHHATVVGSLVNIVPQVFHAPIVHSSTYIALTHWLGRLAT